MSRRLQTGLVQRGDRGCRCGRTRRQGSAGDATLARGRGSRSAASSCRVAASGRLAFRGSATKYRHTAIRVTEARRFRRDGWHPRTSGHCGSGLAPIPSVYSLMYQRPEVPRSDLRLRPGPNHCRYAPECAIHSELRLRHATARHSAGNGSSLRATQQRLFHRARAPLTPLRARRP
jgi:hypothetical protein